MLASILSEVVSTMLEDLVPPIRGRVVCLGSPCVLIFALKKSRNRTKESLQQRSRNELAGGTSVIGARGADEDEQLNETEEVSACR